MERREVADRDRGSVRAGHPRERSLHAFLTALIWICMVPPLALSVGLALDHVRDARDELDRAADRELRNGAAAVEREIRERARALQVLAASPLADDPGRWPDLYAQARAARGSVGSEIVFAGPDRQVRFHTARPFGSPVPEVPAQAGTSAARIAAETGAAAVGDLFVGPLTGVPTIAVAVPGLRSGRVEHIVLGAVRATEFASPLGAVARRSGWELVLLDHTGRPIAASDSQPSGAASSEARRLVAPVKGTAWRLELRIPEHAYALPVQRAGFAMAALVLGAALAGFAGGAWASRRLAASVRALAHPEAGPAPIAIRELGAARQRLDEATAERGRAEAGLRESKARLEAALHAMNDAVAIVDAEGRFVEFNDACVGFHRFATRADCPPTLAEYARILDFYRTSGERVAFEDWAGPRALRGETGTDVEYRLRRIDTGERWVGSYQFAPIRDAEGTIAGAVVSARDVTPIRRTQIELELLTAALRRLIAARDSVQEAERKRIARELHDDLQQTLAAILLEAAAARAAIGGGAVQAAHDGLDRVDHLAGAAVVSLRRLVNDLRPQMLEDLGVVVALDALADGFARRTGIACDFDASALDEGDVRDEQTATCLYRVVQEALNNVAKHAEARRVRIEIASDAQPGAIVLAVSDDGRGFDIEQGARPDSFGLLGISERVHALGGTLRVHSAPGDGARVEVRLPGPAAHLGAQAA